MYNNTFVLYRFDWFINCIVNKIQYYTKNNIINIIDTFFIINIYI